MCAFLDTRVRACVRACESARVSVCVLYVLCAVCVLYVLCDVCVLYVLCDVCVLYVLCDVCFVCAV